MRHQLTGIREYEIIQRDLCQQMMRVSACDGRRKKNTTHKDVLPAAMGLLEVQSVLP